MKFSLQLLKKLIPSVVAAVLSILNKKKQDTVTRAEFEKLEMRIGNVEKQNELLQLLIKKSDN